MLRAFCPLPYSEEPPAQHPCRAPCPSDIALPVSDRSRVGSGGIPVTTAVGSPRGHSEGSRFLPNLGPLDRMSAATV